MSKLIINMKEQNGLASEVIRIESVRDVTIDEFENRIYDFVAFAVNEPDKVVQGNPKGKLKMSNNIITYEIPGEFITTVGLIENDKITFNLDGSETGSIDVDLGDLVELTNEL